jgi:hypothetical protein
VGVRWLGAIDMDTYEKVGYLCLGAVAVLYIVAMLVGMIAAFPFGLIGLVVFIGVGVLLLKVVKERINNKEDSYYSKHVDR